MATLREILLNHGSLLVLDGTGVAQAAWFGGPDVPMRAARGEGDAGLGIFRALAECCPQPNRAGAFAFCEAPGSVLGIRTTATAIRVWTALRPRPVYSYNALQLAAASGGDAHAYIADARRGRWHLLVAGQPPRQVATAELTAMRGLPPLAALEGFRHWEPLPNQTVVKAYDTGALLAGACEQHLFRQTDGPDAALIAQPSYTQWTPRIHQAP